MTVITARGLLRWDHTTWRYLLVSKAALELVDIWRVPVCLEPLISSQKDTLHQLGGRIFVSDSWNTLSSPDAGFSPCYVGKLLWKHAWRALTKVRPIPAVETLIRASYTLRVVCKRRSRYCCKRLAKYAARAVRQTHSQVFVLQIQLCRSHWCPKVDRAVAKFHSITSNAFVLNSLLFFVQ